jgi:hypothetical protein
MNKMQLYFRRLLKLGIKPEPHDPPIAKTNHRLQAKRKAKIRVQKQSRITNRPPKPISK